MDFLFIGLTLGTAGKVLLGIAVVLVHWRMVKEHRLDKAVFTEIRHERTVAVVGILAIILGYLLEVAFYGYIPVPDALLPLTFVAGI